MPLQLQPWELRHWNMDDLWTYFDRGARDSTGVISRFPPESLECPTFVRAEEFQGRFEGLEGIGEYELSNWIWSRDP